MPISTVTLSPLVRGNPFQSRDNRSGRSHPRPGATRPCLSQLAQDRRERRRRQRRSLCQVLSGARHIGQARRAVRRRGSGEPGSEPDQGDHTPPSRGSEIARNGGATELKIARGTRASAMRAWNSGWSEERAGRSVSATPSAFCDRCRWLNQAGEGLQTPHPGLERGRARPRGPFPADSDTRIVPLSSWTKPGGAGVAGAKKTTDPFDSDNRRCAGAHGADDGHAEGRAPMPRRRPSRWGNRLALAGLPVYAPAVRHSTDIPQRDSRRGRRALREARTGPP